jgi:23S rRNA pseudouridine2605 synthase
MRLAKFIAHAGAASRRHAEELIRAGRVEVDGERVLDVARDVDGTQRVALDGRVLAGAEPRVVYAVHKPAGVVSTARDPQGRPTVVGLVPHEHARLYPVGRLDADTTGLILLTNDGELAQRLTHPSFEVPKTYRARLLGGPVQEAALRALRSGVRLEDGITAPAQVKRVSPSELELTIHEGRKRQVRRMCDAVGHRVQTLRRVAIGPLRLGTLAPGAHRRLSDGEIRRLRAAARVEGRPAGGAGRRGRL